jgi:hypothetical protein
MSSIKNFSADFLIFLFKNCRFGKNYTNSKLQFAQLGEFNFFLKLH